ncbi:hypothetical protein E2C01_075685 [Portunus trituberculatus]|uniref:Uncharacterized protein n=1 Tax=Portunus trituberculatus TaxID=210409 RepID=A0A5B7IGF5_PORTR|nr:hypothetical protein [Portunus trituberculatus]
MMAHLEVLPLSNPIPPTFTHHILQPTWLCLRAAWWGAPPASRSTGRVVCLESDPYQQPHTPDHPSPDLTTLLAVSLGRQKGQLPRHLGEKGNKSNSSEDDALRGYVTQQPLTLAHPTLQPAWLCLQAAWGIRHRATPGTRLPLRLTRISPVDNPAQEEISLFQEA